MPYTLPKIGLLVVLFLQLFAASFPVFADQTVTATIPATASNFPTTLTSTSSGTTFAQNKTINYQISYGSTLPTATNITFTAFWPQGTIEGTGSPSVDILTYVSGSATNAYDSTAPVIDTTNRTITWTINSFPGNTTGQLVTFSLQTTGNYTGSSLVDFSVSAHTNADSVTTTDSTVNQKYLYETATPGPTSTPGPAAAATPTPNETKLTFTDIHIRSISADTTALSLSTSKNSTVTLYYGTGTNALVKTLTDLTNAKQHVLTLSGLKQNTRYYFQAIAKDDTGKIMISDTYTFLTARFGNGPMLTPSNTVITSGNTILFGQNPLNPSENPLIVIPFHTAYTFRINLNDDEKITSVYAIFRATAILGTNTSNPEHETENLMTETEPGLFTGTFQAANSPFSGILVARVSDSNHAITELKIADVRVVKPFGVFDGKTKEPIEHAKLLLSVFNESNKSYRVVSPDVLPIKNPFYTNPDGTAILSLPAGSYKLTVSATGYTEKTLSFTIGPQVQENYPQIMLTKKPFTITGEIRYFSDIFSTLFQAGQNSIHTLASTHRFFDVLTTVILLCFLFLTLISFGARLEIALTFLPWFILFRIKRLLRIKTGVEIGGDVVDFASGRPVSHANIYAFDAKNTLFSHTTTNYFGQWMLHVPNSQSYVLTVQKTGFQQIKTMYKKETLKEPVIITLHKHETRPLFHAILESIETVIGFFFETLLVLSFLLEIALGNSLGWMRIFPFFCISLFNLLLWIVHLYHIHKR